MTTSPWRIAESIPLSAIRLALGGLFLWAGFLKAADPQAFAFAIKGYGLLEGAGAGHVIRLMAYTIPWAEIICGLLIVSGAWTRGAAMFLAIQLGLFTVANALVLEKEIKCSCFGDSDPFCGDAAIGWCHIIRNSSMLAAALLLAWRGAGIWSVDRAMSRMSARAAEARARELENDPEGL
ncbi:MAG: DoxX family protein [Planctomycetota bacterium]